MCEIIHFKVDLQGSFHRLMNAIMLSELPGFIRTGLGSVLVIYELGFVTLTELSTRQIGMGD